MRERSDDPSHLEQLLYHRTTFHSLFTHEDIFEYILMDKVYCLHSAEPQLKYLNKKFNKQKEEKKYITAPITGLKLILC